MPRLTPPRPAAPAPRPRALRNSINDRIGRLTVLRRRARRLLPPIAATLGFAIVLIVLAGLARGAAPGSWLARLGDQLARSGALAGFRIASVVIEGRANTPEPLLRAAIGATQGDPILGYALAAARARVESLSWIDHATIERRLPATIVVRVQERRPFAIWQNQGKFQLIDRDGQIVAGQDISSFTSLPLVVGPGAPAAAAALLDALTDRPALQARVVAAVRVVERRWNLRLASGTDVLLPEEGLPAALDRLAALQASVALLDRPIRRVDLRVPDRLIVSPAAATAPDEAHPPTPARKPT